jgi:hypothetical protein
MPAFRGAKKPIFRTFLFKISKGRPISKGNFFGRFPISGFSDSRNLG